MKFRSTILALALLLSGGLMAQYSEIYQSSDQLYTDGVSLYHQGQYAASKSKLEAYRGVTYREQSQFYIAANAFDLRQKNALPMLQSYIKSHPYTPYASEVHFMIGALQVEKGKHKQALKEFEQVEDEHLFRTHQADYLFYRGYAHLEMNEPQRAAGCFSRLKQMKSKYTQQAKYYYGYTQYTVGNYGKALPDFLAIENTQSYKDIVPYYIVQIYFAQEQYDEVFERAETLLSNNPKNANNQELQRMLGEIYYHRGEYDKAITYLSEYANPKSEEQKQQIKQADLYLLGMSYYQVEDYNNAVVYLNKTINSKADKNADKQDVEAMLQNSCYHIGNAYTKLGNTEQAKLAYAAVANYKCNPELREEAQYNYALTTYQSSTALGESVSAFTDFLQLYPQSKHREQVFELLSDVFMTSKNYAAALEALDEIEKPTSKMLQTKQYLRYQIATDAFVQGQSKRAIEYFTEVISNSADNQDKYVTESYFWRAESEYKLRQYSEAQTDIQTFLSRSDAASSVNYVKANYSLGYAYFSQKQYSEAKKYFEKYIEKADKGQITYADALNRIGDSYFNDRDFVKAESYYAKVIALGGSGADYATFQRGYALGLLNRYNDKINTLEKLVKQYPKSDYADDGLYEIARAYLQQDNNAKAIEAYERLLSSYPNSNMARKAALEKGMIHYNEREFDLAIESYKQVIKKYPGSEEAYSALDGLESAYVETDNVAEYLAYTKSLGRLNMKIDTHEDSLTFAAAERQYMFGSYQQAVAGMGKYLSQYCAGGRYCTMAQYYLADSYYQLGQKQEAQIEYQKLSDIGSNPYMEEACTRVAEISYDNKDYRTSLEYFKKLERVAGTKEKINVARLGILRCSYYLKDNQTTISVASQILNDNTASADVQAEALYNRAKAYYDLKQNDLAIDDCKQLAKDMRTATGAEAKYMLCQIYYNIGDTEQSEAQILEFASSNTQQTYWLTRSFIVLSDLYRDKGELFQAKQYLISLQNNYKAEDDVQDILKEHLQIIAQMENPTENSINESGNEE